MILSLRMNHFPLTARVIEIGKRIDEDATVAHKLTISKIHSRIAKARKEQRMAQREAKELRVQWLEGAARTKAAEDDEKAQQEILRMIRHMHIVAMHQKLTRIIKGPHTGLDYVEVPTGQWYFAKDINELYHYDDGLFECHVAIEDKFNAFYTHSSLKVPPSNLTEVLVEYNDNSIIILPGVIGPITWRKVTEKAEMEDILYYYGIKSICNK
jgi:hypothetical protein